MTLPDMLFAVLGFHEKLCQCLSFRLLCVSLFILPSSCELRTTSSLDLVRNEVYGLIECGCTFRALRCGLYANGVNNERRPSVLWS
jgi:hypothetical protein